MKDNPSPKSSKWRRRTAKLNAAALRMGYKTWSEFESVFTEIILPENQNQPIGNDIEVLAGMTDVIDRARKHVHDREPDASDINQILINYPRKTRGGGGS